MKSLTRKLCMLMTCIVSMVFTYSLMHAQDNSIVAEPRNNKDQNNPAIVTIPLGINSASRAVAVDVRNAREVKIGLSNASVTPFGIATGGRPLYGGDFDGSGTWYAVSTPDTLYTIDTASGAFTQLGQIAGIPAGSNTSGLAWDYSTGTMYACNLSGGLATLYTIDLGTRTASPAGTIISGTVIDIACSNEGQLYGIKFGSAAGVSDSLISIDKNTGAGTVVGPLGVDVNFAHGLDFDPVTDSLFYPGYIGGGVNNLYRINTSTGNAELVGALAAGEYDCFSVIGQPSSGQTCGELSSQWAVGQYPNLPSATYFQASAWLGDTLYLQAPTTAGAGDVAIYKYTLGGPWTTGTPLPAAKVGGSLTKCGSKLYYIGGGTTTITTGTTDVYEYDPSTGVWTTKAPLPVALSAHGAVCWGDSVIFVIGGPYTGATTNLDVHYYRPASDTWGTIANSLPANQGRRTFGHGISGNKIVISAGYNTAYLKSTYIGTIGSDASQITWTAAPDVPTIYAGLSRPGGTAYGDYFYLVCGERAGAGGYYDTTHVFKISTQTWTYIVNNKPVDMSNIFNGVTARCVDDTVRVFVPGGYSAAAVDVFDVIGAGPSLLTDVRIENKELPTTFSLDQNYPNPFNPSTTIQFALPTSAQVTLQVFNVLGQEVATLVKGERAAGTYQVLWDGRTSSGAPVASGVYFYSLVAKGGNINGSFTTFKKMLLLK